jgi:hypothetical protein
VSIAQVLSEVARADELATYPAFAPGRLEATTQFFLDLVIECLLKRALFETTPKLSCRYTL